LKAPPVNHALLFTLSACKPPSPFLPPYLTGTNRPRIRKKRQTTERLSVASLPCGEHHLDNTRGRHGNYWENNQTQYDLTSSQAVPSLSYSNGMALQDMVVSEGGSRTSWASSPRRLTSVIQQGLGNDTNSQSLRPGPGVGSGGVLDGKDLGSETVARKEDEPQATTYIGRSHYVDGDSPIDETSARSYTASRVDGLSDNEMKTLEIWGSFHLPPRSARQSLIETFIDYCYPWMPIISSPSLDESDDRPTSLLLQQSLFLAASRVSSSPGVLDYASSEQFYQRAKALFWAGHEKDPLTVITSITMLQWYNPDGAAFVSYDSSEFWLKTGVGIAYQIGLHKEPPQGPQRSIRRRIWWTLVVSFL
jgi:hypothetical protein